MLTDIEKRVLASIQGDIEITTRPYLKIAESLGIEEETLLEILEDLCKKGVIRRFGATLRHQKSGFSANAMVAWQIPEDKIEEVGSTLAGFVQVSHCYRRNPNALWPFNLYTMVHATSEAECYQIAEKMSAQTGMETYSLLFSRKELKKTSMAYFADLK
jgi:DNA-binding Lrp family transcriptional regulator